AAIGVLAGIWMGSSMLALYHEYFTFPSLSFHLRAVVVVQAFLIAAVSAIVGARAAARRAVRIAPAEAMRPEAPVRYSPSLPERVLPPGWLATTSRMIARNLQRQPMRAVTTIGGIAMAGAILQVGFGLIESVEGLILRQFNVAERQSMSVSFVEPLGPEARHALAQLPGVLFVEPDRAVPARLRAGHVERTVAITAVPEAPELKRPLDAQLRPVLPRGGGLVLSSILGE